jgi:hypothetical protein
MERRYRGRETEPGERKIVKERERERKRERERGRDHLPLVVQCLV